jgi:hypothetical protein
MVRTRFWWYQYESKRVHMARLEVGKGWGFGERMVLGRPMGSVSEIGRIYRIGLNIGRIHKTGRPHRL